MTEPDNEWKVMLAIAALVLAVLGGFALIALAAAGGCP